MFAASCDKSEITGPSRVGAMFAMRTLKNLEMFPESSCASRPDCSRNSFTVKTDTAQGRNPQEKGDAAASRELP
jgi:hypothetical protein